MFWLDFISIALNVILLGLCFFEYLEIEKLRHENFQIKKRKVYASDRLIQTFEKAMIDAIDAGKIKQYQKYRDMYNDLNIKESKNNNINSYPYTKRSVF